MKYSAFISYSHKDSEFVLDIKNLLDELKDEFFEVWYDGKIIGGERWEPKIFKQLYESQIIFLMISPNFAESEFCQKELSKALQKEIMGECRIIPIYTHDFDYKNYKFSQFQFLPDGKTPLSTIKKQNEENYFNVLKDLNIKIKDSINDFNESYQNKLGFDIHIDNNNKRKIFLTNDILRELKYIYTHSFEFFSDMNEHLNNLYDNREKIYNNNEINIFETFLENLHDCIFDNFLTEHYIINIFIQKNYSFEHFIPKLESIEIKNRIKIEKELIQVLIVNNQTMITSLYDTKNLMNIPSLYDTLIITFPQRNEIKNDIFITISINKNNENYINKYLAFTYFRIDEFLGHVFDEFENKFCKISKIISKIKKYDKMSIF